MSYDLQVWSVRPFRGDFRHAESWESGPSAWTHARKNWQIVVSAPDRVEPDDIPEDISKLLPGVEWLTNLNLEGAGTQEAFRLVQSTADMIAKSAHGAVLDPQEDIVRLPSGVKRFLLPRSRETFDIVSLSWWFLDSPLITPEGRAAFVDLLERILPEALPKRYGLYEPPQHRYAETGKKHLLAFLDANLHDMAVWYPNRPVVSVYLGLPTPLGAGNRGFRANHLKIEIEKDALSQPGWAKNLKLFWQQSSALVRPFFGDVRILSGYRWMGATVSSSGKGSRHPVTGWWWKGIPEDLGSAVVLGDVYQRLWSKFASAATTIDGLAFASVDDWSRGENLSNKVGRPPTDQIQRVHSTTRGPLNIETIHELISKRRRNPPDRNAEYASGWPFGQPFAP